MSNEISAAMNPGQPMVYQIRMKGHLGRHWTDWFEGLSITAPDRGSTLLTGPGGRSGRLAWRAEISARYRPAIARGAFVLNLVRQMPQLSMQRISSVQ